MADEADDTESWSRIESAADALHPGQTPQHWGTVQRYSEGGPDPLDGISAYAGQDPPHWHYVTFGFSELGPKQSKNRKRSARSSSCPTPGWAGSRPPTAPSSS